MATFTAGTSFSDGVTGDVTAAKLNALVANATPLSNLITDRTAETTVASGDLALIADASDSNNLKKMTVSNLFKTDVSITSATGTAGTVAIGPTGDTNTGLFFPAADTIAFSEGGTEAMRIDSSGNVGIGTNTPVGRLRVKASAATFTSGLSIQRNNTADTYEWVVGTDNSLYLGYATNASGADAEADFTSRVVLDSSGNVGIGTSSPAQKLHVYGSGPVLQIESSTAQEGYVLCKNTSGQMSFGMSGAASNSFLLYDRTNNQSAYAYNGGASGSHQFYTNATERLRITSGGLVLIGKTTSAVGTAGVELATDGEAVFTRAGAIVSNFNRNTDDGTIINLRQDSNIEGTISVSGNTVSYNAFAGSHWSQLEDGSKPEILRGTVIESIDQLCEWPNEENERLPKCKISDTAASKKVYGVFLDWDNDWTETNDLYVTSLGAFVCRVNSSVTVQIGDLLESNGDGTARVQADDVIRSSTIGKVTSNVKTHEHPDGSYCVPTVLYCG